VKLSYFIQDLLATSKAFSKASVMTAPFCFTDGLSIGSEFSPSVLLFKSSNLCLALTGPGWEGGDPVDGHMGLVGGKLRMDCAREEAPAVDTCLSGGNPSEVDDTFEEIDGGTVEVSELYGGKRDLVGDILELKLEDVEKTSFSFDLAVDGDDGVLLEEVSSFDDEAHSEI
jgi:hypothetical protein